MGKPVHHHLNHATGFHPSLNRFKKFTPHSENTYGHLIKQKQLLKHEHMMNHVHSGKTTNQVHFRVGLMYGRVKRGKAPKEGVKKERKHTQSLKKRLKEKSLDHIFHKQHVYHKQKHQRMFNNNNQCHENTPCTDKENPHEPNHAIRRNTQQLHQNAVTSCK